jgi:hypothetical protein
MSLELWRWVRVNARVMVQSQSSQKQGLGGANKATLNNMHGR